MQRKRLTHGGGIPPQAAARAPLCGLSQGGVAPATHPRPLNAVSGLCGGGRKQVPQDKTARLDR